MIRFSNMLDGWNEFFHSRFLLSTSAGGRKSSTSSNGRKSSTATTSTSTTSATATATTTNSWNAKFIGYLRVVYALCLLYDRLILSLDYEMFFLYSSSPLNDGGNSIIGSSKNSNDVVLPMIPCQRYMVPVSATMSHSIVDLYLPSSPLCAIASYVPIAYYNTIFVTFHIVGLIQIVLLLCGIYPKCQLVGIQLNMIAYHYHTELLWDGEDVMFKLWNVFFLLLPLNIGSGCINLTDGFGWWPNRSRSRSRGTDTESMTVATTTTTKNIIPSSNSNASPSTSTTSSLYYSYPMWPIRLFQIELCCIYAGAGYAKLSTTVWRSGNALYHVIHEKDFFGGPYVPEFIFHRYGPLKLATWSSLLLECSCIFLVWSRHKSIKYGTVFSMIALHVGIELTMNMHVFEILSIIGWCMFFIEPTISYKDYSDKANTTTMERTSESSATSISRFFIDMAHHIWFINIFLFCIITIIVIDTFPLYELYTILESVFAAPLLELYNTLNNSSTSPSKLSFLYGITTIIAKVQKLLLDLYDLRRAYYFSHVMQFLYPFGLYQDVWNLYSGAPDTNCMFTTNISTYYYNNDTSNSIILNNSHSYVSPDWGNMTWYMKKRYQRPMTMQEKFENHMCRECYIRYHANSIIKTVRQQQIKLSATDPTTAMAVTPKNIQLASATLTIQCENPPDPPVVDDWFNWTGWFYANAKQDVLIQHAPYLLHSINMCNDMNIDLCQQYYNDGLCTTAHDNHAYRHSLDNGTIRTDHDSFVYNITQTCRVSCSWCPEHGYDTDDLQNGTRITIFWPIPTWNNLEQLYMYDPTSIYYDGTIIEVRDHPLKQYLIKYDVPGYKNEWFDPMILRDRGYHFIPPAVEENNDNNDSNGDTSSTTPDPDVNNDDDEIGGNDEDDDETTTTDAEDDSNEQDEL